MSNAFRYGALLVVVAMTVSTVTAATAPTLSTKVVAGEVEEPVIEETTSEDTEKVQEALPTPDWREKLEADPELSALAWCESRHNPRAMGHGDTLITGFPSYGLVQFQPGTFKAFVRKYDLLPNTEDEELPNLYFDPDVQIELATRMLNDGLGRHWFHCYYSKYGSGAHRTRN